MRKYLRPIISALVANQFFIPLEFCSLSIFFDLTSEINAVLPTPSSRQKNEQWFALFA